MKSQAKQKECIQMVFLSKQILTNDKQWMVIAPCILRLHTSGASVLQAVEPLNTVVRRPPCVASAFLGKQASITVMDLI